MPLWKPQSPFLKHIVESLLVGFSTSGEDAATTACRASFAICPDLASVTTENAADKRLYMNRVLWALVAEIKFIYRVDTLSEIAPRLIYIYDARRACQCGHQPSRTSALQWREWYAGA
jgi:hypothetical protein